MTTVNLRKVSLLNKIRSVVGRIMQYAELPVHLGVKFIGFLILYRFINNAEMFAAVEQTGLFHKDSVLMVLALAAALLPNRGGVFIGIALVVWNVFQLSLMGAILVGLVLLLLYVVAAGLFPDHVYLLVLVPAAIRLNWLLAVPLAAGMYMGAVAIIPAAVGVIMYGFFNIIPLFLGLQMDGSLDGIPKLIDEAARSGLDTIMSNESLAYLMIVFAGVIVVTSLVRGLHVNFSRYIALGAGSILGLVTLLGGVSSGNVSSDSLVLHSVLTILVMLFLELLSVPLSYKSAQLLEFEDDDYLYKVKMIPKMTNTNMLPGGETRMTGVNARAAGRKLRDLLPGKKGQASEAELQQETSPAAEAQAPARTMHAQGIQEIVFPLSEGEPVDLALAPGGAVEYGGQYGEFVPEVGPEAVPEVDNPAQEVSGETLVVPGFGTAAPSEGGTIVAPAPAAAGEDPMASTAQSILMDETEESATDLFEEFSHRVGPDR